MTHHIELWMVYALLQRLGFTQVIDNPTRQTLSIEMVGSDYLKNAVTLTRLWSMLPELLVRPLPVY